MVQICHVMLASTPHLPWLTKSKEISEQKMLLLLFIPLNSQFLESERQEFCASQRKELGIMQKQQQKERNTTCGAAASRK